MRCAKRRGGGRCDSARRGRCQTVTGKPTAYEDATVWTNESMAQYFGVKSVRVGDVGENVGALLRETHIVAFGSL